MVAVGARLKVRVVACARCRCTWGAARCPGQAKNALRRGRTWTAPASQVFFRASVDHRRRYVFFFCAVDFAIGVGDARTCPLESARRILHVVVVRRSARRVYRTIWYGTRRHSVGASKSSAGAHGRADLCLSLSLSLSLSLPLSLSAPQRQGTCARAHNESCR